MLRKASCVNRRELPFPNHAEDGSDAYGVVMRTRPWKTTWPPSVP
jgi:hypothetical protein